MANKIKINFLGTAAHIPTVKRNHTAILLSHENENILVDCGEGTQRQFRRAKLNPCKITRILITHFHGDHVFGLLGLISTLSLNGYNKTLFIYCPRGIKKFLENFLAVRCIQGNFEIKIEEVEGKFLDTNDFYLEAEKMEHNVKCNAYNFVLKEKIKIDKRKLSKTKLSEGKHLQKLKEGKDIFYEGKKYFAKKLTYVEKGKKISFVLDTLYNERIVHFVKNADLFICESSFLENSENGKELAKEHMHLTAKQAAGIAKKAKVGKLILTHISQRYEKNENKILDEAKKIFKNTKIADDFDNVSV